VGWRGEFAQSEESLKNNADPELLLTKLNLGGKKRNYGEKEKGIRMRGGGK